MYYPYSEGVLTDRKKKSHSRDVTLSLFLSRSLALSLEVLLPVKMEVGSAHSLFCVSLC